MIVSINQKFSSDSPSPLYQSPWKSSGRSHLSLEPLFTRHPHCGSLGAVLFCQDADTWVVWECALINIGWLAFKCRLTYLIIYAAFGVYWNASLQLLILEALHPLLLPGGFRELQTHKSKQREGGGTPFPSSIMHFSWEVGHYQPSRCCVPVLMGLPSLPVKWFAFLPLLPCVLSALRGSVMALPVPFLIDGF